MVLADFPNFLRAPSKLKSVRAMRLSPTYKIMTSTPTLKQMKISLLLLSQESDGRSRGRKGI